MLSCVSSGTCKDDSGARWGMASLGAEIELDTRIDFARPMFFSLSISLQATYLIMYVHPSADCLVATWPFSAGQ